MIIFYFLHHASGVLLNGDPYEVPIDKNIRLADFNNPQINCLVLREIMEALPAYVPIKKGIKDYFKKGSSQNMKSFREIAMNVFNQIDYEDDVKRQEIAQRIEELRTLKAEYNDKFRNDVDLDFDKEAQEQEDLTAKMNILAGQINAKKKEIFNDKKEHMKVFAKVTGFVNKSLRETGPTSINYLIQKYQFFQRFLNRANVFFHDPDETANFVQFVEENFKNADALKGEIENLVVKSQEQRTLKSLVEGLNFYGEMVLFKDTVDGDFSRINFITETQVKKDHKAVQAHLKSVHKSIKSSVKSIQGDIKGQMKKIKKDFQKQKNYQSYVKHIKYLRQVRDVRRQKSEQLEALEDAHEKLANKVGNLNMSSDMSFTIPQDSIENQQKKINLLDTKAAIFNTSKADALSMEFKTKMVDVMERYKIIFHQMKALTDLKLQRMREKIELSERIDEYEKYFDVELGKIFAVVQVMADGRGCFTKAQLSYIFFAMVKTNVIIKEKEFLDSFLSSLPYIVAKDFIIYNYEIFANEQFILSQIDRDDLKEKLDEYRTSEQRAVVSTYINNWSFLVNMYKDYTEFGTKSEGGKVKKVGMGHRLSRILGISAQKFFNLSKDSGYNEYFAVFAGELLKMIPFLGNVPFLTSILATVLAYLTEFIIDLIFKFFQNAGPVIKSFMDNVAPVFGIIVHKEIYDLDYTKYVDFGEDVQEDDEEGKMAKITVNVFDIEKEYLQKIEDTDSAENNGDQLYLFEDDTHSIEVSKLGIPEVQSGLEQLNEQGELSPDGLSKLEHYKAQQAHIKQHKEQLQQQHDQNAPVVELNNDGKGGGNGRLLTV